MNNRFLLIFLFSSLCFFKGQAQIIDTTKHDTVFFKSTFIPLEVQQPTIKIETIKADPLDFHVILNSDSILITFSNISFKIMSVDNLDKFIKDHDIYKVSPKIYLEASKEVPIERVKEVIQIFTNNDINRFNLISR